MTPTSSSSSSAKALVKATSKSQVMTPSKWLFQASPPDLSESPRWTFALYEILDIRHAPVDPRVLHSVYRGVVVLEPDELPDTKDPHYSAKLEESVVRKYKSLVADS
jgi:hypothetical protein